MKDPTRIPEVIAALGRLWEAQPDRGLAEVWSTLETRGVGGATTDEELLALLEGESTRHPVVLRESDLHKRIALIDTEAPGRKVTLDSVDGRVTVRATDSASIRPTSWKGGKIRHLTVGLPLVVTDASGIDHRLGVVREIAVDKRPRAVDLSGALRRTVGDRVYGATTQDDQLVLIGHSIEVYDVGLREVTATKIRYERIVRCVAGETLTVTERGGQRLELGTVRELFPVEL